MPFRSPFCPRQSGFRFCNRRPCPCVRLCRCRTCSFGIAPGVRLPGGIGACRAAVPALFRARRRRSRREGKPAQTSRRAFYRNHPSAEAPPLLWKPPETDSDTAPSPKAPKTAVSRRAAERAEGFPPTHPKAQAFPAALRSEGARAQRPPAAIAQGAAFPFRPEEQFAVPLRLMRKPDPQASLSPVARAEDQKYHAARHTSAGVRTKIPDNPP